MSEKAQMSPPDDASATTFYERSGPASNPQIAMPETKPAKNASAEHTGITSQRQAHG